MIDNKSDLISGQLINAQMLNIYLSKVIIINCKSHNYKLILCREAADFLMASTMRMSLSPSSPGTRTFRLFIMANASLSICIAC